MGKPCSVTTAEGRDLRGVGGREGGRIGAIIEAVIILGSEPISTAV